MAIERKRKKMKRTQISLPEEQLKAVREYAHSQGVSLSHIVRDALDDKINASTPAHDPFRHLIGAIQNGNPQDSDDEHFDMMGFERL